MEEVAEHIIWISRAHEATKLREEAQLIRAHLDAYGDLLGPAMLVGWERVAASTERLADALTLPPTPGLERAA